MKKSVKITIVVALVATVTFVLALKRGDAPVTTVPQPVSTPLPKLIDLGADKCIPCKMMAPILDDLRKEYAGKCEVVFIDVWKDPDAGKAYNIEIIPTQLFFDASGKELFRHTGFFSKEDILGKWKELGIDLAASRPAGGAK
jgi:thioredoxin 1